MPQPKKPRRKPLKRFQCVTVVGPFEKVNLIRAESVDQVRKHYERRGYRVKSVIPYNTANVKAMNGGGWRKSTAGFAKAQRDLGLILPIVVQQIGRVGTTNANYGLFIRGQEPRGVVAPARLFHVLKAKSYHTAEQASESLWHEVTHAWQAEKAIRAAIGDEDWQRNPTAAVLAWDRVLTYQNTIPYANRPIEREARRNAAAMNQQYKLALRA